MKIERIIKLSLADYIIVGSTYYSYYLCDEAVEQLLHTLPRKARVTLSTQPIKGSSLVEYNSNRARCKKVNNNEWQDLYSCLHRDIINLKTNRFYILIEPINNND